MKKSTGVRHLLAHRAGRKLSWKAAALAKCADCMNFYVDGMNDCRVPACPLYPLMPYRQESIPSADTPVKRGANGTDGAGPVSL